MSPREPSNPAPLQMEAIVESYYSAIFAFAAQFLGSRADAEDATQEVFLKAQQKLASLRDGGALRPWLYRIARNCCVDRTRWWRSSPVSAGDALPEPSSDPSQELSAIIRQLVLRLPARQREVFVLRHWHDCSTAETAEILGIDEGSVKSHLSRAVHRLKRDLCEREMTTEMGREPSS